MRKTLIKSVFIFIAMVLVTSLLLTLPLILSSCGNKDMFDTVYTYNYAIIQLPNGEIVEGEVDQWRDYEGEQIQVKMKNGDIYLASTYNITLIQRNTD